MSGEYMKRVSILALSALLGIATWHAGPSWRGTPQQAFAQTVGCEGAGCFDAYKLSYFDVATAFAPSAGGYGGAGNSGGIGDALLRIVDAGNFEVDTEPGDVCANIYVYNDVQEQQECCSCPLTANALLTVSVINDLISNPFNPKESLSAGVIKIVGSSGTCSNLPTATTAAGPYTIAGGLHEWINHTEMVFSPKGAATSSTSLDRFANAVLDSGELASLQAGCAAINAANEHASEAIGICKCAPPPPPPITVSVAYANNFDSDPVFFPSNAPGWKGTTGVIPPGTPGANYFGFAADGEFDGGAIEIQNISTTESVVVNGVTVDLNQLSPVINCTIGTGTTIADCPNDLSTAVDPTDAWVGVFPYTIAPGGFLILGQSNAGLAPGSSAGCGVGLAQCSNFDTSDLPPLGKQLPPSCEHDGVIPKVHVNVAVDSNPATILTFTDTNQVLNTGGIDGADCNVPPGHPFGFEGHNWVQIH